MLALRKDRGNISVIGVDKDVSPLTEELHMATKKKAAKKKTAKKKTAKKKAKK
jgi:hypothetical protein